MAFLQDLCSHLGMGQRVRRRHNMSSATELRMRLEGWIRRKRKEDKDLQLGYLLFLAKVQCIFF